MEDPYCCPNMKTCRLVSQPEFNTGITARDVYLDIFCRSKSQKWLECKRYITKMNLGFCPDSVLPDTKMTPEEIIDKFDEDNSNI